MLDPSSARANLEREACVFGDTRENYYVNSSRYENSNMVPSQGSNCGSLSHRRITTMSAAAAVKYVQGKDSLLHMEVERRSEIDLLRAYVESRIDPLLGQKVVGIFEGFND